MLLKEKHKNILTSIFSELTIPVEVWAYGSRVTGEAHEGSDLDLVMRTETLDRVPIDIFLDMKEKILVSRIPIIVELFDWARLPDSFHKNIEANHEVLFSNFEIILNEPKDTYGLNRKKNDTKDI
ncbi:MAG: nucleotidyltransferase domain-containing protein [Sediminibacterium sp.]|nr:nucleotidyltransferase domain-containing protein [Sediminibacterium sp.]MBX9778721.1 nucleotidyltransferase domain-containing protein [Chitinophagaceae bacterium]